MYRLTAEGHSVEQAPDGRAAVDAAATFHPDVILDIGMPGINGYAVAQTLRKRPEMSSLVLTRCRDWDSRRTRLAQRKPDSIVISRTGECQRAPGVFSQQPVRRSPSNRTLVNRVNPLRTNAWCVSVCVTERGQNRFANMLLQLSHIRPVRFLRAAERSAHGRHERFSNHRLTLWKFDTAIWLVL